MTVRVIVNPVNMAVSLADARNAARVNGTDLDGELETHVRALTAEAEHYTGRAIINRTYRITLDEFPDAIELPSTPLASVSSVSVKYIDPAGLEQTLDPADYIVDDKSEPGYIVPGVDLAWPETRVRINAVNVVAVCGYGADDTTTPAPFKAFILARLKEIYAPAGTPESPFLIRGLDSMRVY